MKKDIYFQMNIGKAKYVFSFHDGIKKHKDGSPFYDIKIFHNKMKAKAFIKDMISQGYEIALPF